MKRCLENIGALDQAIKVQNEQGCGGISSGKFHVYFRQLSGLGALEFLGCRYFVFFDFWFFFYAHFWWAKLAHFVE